MSRKPSKLRYLPQILTFAFFAFFLRYVLRIKIRGKENLVACRQPVVVVANHSSKLDPFVILSAMGWRYFLRFYLWKFPLAKEYAQTWWIGKPATLAGCYEISSKGSLDESLKETFQAIDEGYSMIFFPEGGMVRKGKTVEPKRGIGYMCVKKDLRIIPVKIEYKNFDRKGRGRQSKAMIIFGEQFNSRDFKKEIPSEELHLAVMRRVYDLK